MFSKTNKIFIGPGIASYQLSETKLKNFWKKMDQINIWNWEKDLSEKFLLTCLGKRLRSNKMQKVVNGHSRIPS